MKKELRYNDQNQEMNRFELKYQMGGISEKEREGQGDQG